LEKNYNSLHNLKQANRGSWQT